MSIKIHYFHNPYKEINQKRREELDYVYAENMKVGFDYIHEIKGYPTFRKYFRHANYYIELEKECDHITVFANQDIAFPENFISKILEHSKKDVALCLSRWNLECERIKSKKTGKKIWKLFNRAGSQDTWILYGIIKIPKSCDFQMGVPACDKRIMYELKSNGYIIKNPSKSIKTLHIHNVKMPWAKKPLQGKYHLCWPHE